jgi:hypothetical protein
LAGNSFLSFSGIHIEMERSQINPFKTRRQQISLFAPKSAQLLRLFLTQPGPWKVEAMAKKGGVSLGQVSKVRKLLLEKEYGAIDPAGGLVLKNGHALLDAWRAVAKPPQVRMRAYTALHGPALEMKLAELFGLRTGPGRYVLASHSVARRIAPFARMSGEMFYADPAGLLSSEEHWICFLSTKARTSPSMSRQTQGCGKRPSNCLADCVAPDLSRPIWIFVTQVSVPAKPQTTCAAKKLHQWLKE